MTRVRFALALIFAALLSIPGVVDGQEDDPFAPGAGPDSVIGKPWSVPDSQEILFILSKARKAVEAGKYEQAALEIQKILDFHGNRVILDGPASRERFIGARLWIHRYLESLPEEARRAYRAMTGPLAMRMLERAERTRDPALLAEVLRRFYLSGAGPRALRAFATLTFSEGDYAEAAHRLGELRRDFPAAVVPADLALLALARLRAGDAEGAAELIEGRNVLALRREPVRVGDAEESLAEFLAGLEPRLEAIRARPDLPAGDWPVYGGSTTRTKPAPAFDGPGPAEWSVRTGYTTRNDDREVPEYGRFNRYLSEWLTRDHYPIHPVASRGVLYYQNGSTVFARNLLTGTLLWSAEGPIVRNNLGKTNPATVHSVAVAGGIVYANLEIPVPAPPPDAREYANRTVIYYIPERRIFAFDAGDGRLLWSHENDPARPEEDRRLLTELNENSPPLVVDDTLYVTASRLDSRYFCYVLAADAKTGKILWRTRVCTGQQELNLFGRPIKELAPGAISERDGVLYLSTNLGVAAALDRRSGEILWLKGYDQIPIPYSVRWYEPEERTPTWTNAPPIVTEDTVYLTPTDSEKLVALHRSDGNLRFYYHGGRPDRDREWVRRLLGIGPKYIYAAGSRVIAIDRRTGKLVWRSNRGTFGTRRPGEEEEVAWGRGAVTPDAVWVTTARGLYSFDPESGERLSFDPLAAPSPGEDQPGEAGGNLLVSGSVLVLAGQDDLTGFYRKERIYDGLRQRAKAAPDDPRVALELGEIYAKWGRFPEAVVEYRRALELAAGQASEERSRIETSARRGLYTIHIDTGEKALEEGRTGAARKELEAALQAAVSAPEKIRAWLALADTASRDDRPDDLAKIYDTLSHELGDVVHWFPSEGSLPVGLYALLRLTDLELDRGRPAEAIRDLGRIIAEYPDEEIAGVVVSHVFAREQIDRILATEGREIYEPFEAEADRLLAEATDTGSADLLADVVRLYPNSRAARKASVALGETLLRAGDYRRASSVLRRVLADFPDSQAAPTLLRLLSEALEKRGYLVSAKSALSRLARRFPDAKIEVEGREVVAGEWAAARLAEPVFAALSERVPRITLPLEELWTEDEGSSSYVRVLQPGGLAPPGTEGTLLLGTNDLMKAVDAQRHQTLWRRKMNGIVTRPVYAEGTLVLVNSASISAVDPESGARLWEMPVNASVRAVEGSPGLVFVLTADFRDPTNLLLRAIAPKSGEEVWHREFENRQVYDLLLVTEEAVGLAAREPAGITVLDAATGRQRFTVDMLPRSLYREPFLVDDDKLFVAHGNQRFELHDMATGNNLWERRLPDERNFRSAIPVPGGVLVTDRMENLMILDAATGEIRFTVPPIADAPLQYQGETADSERIYVVRRRESDSVYVAEARDLKTGKLLWRTDLVESKSATPAPIVTERAVIYHVNSYDFAQGAWTSKSVFLDKKTGEALQEIAPAPMQGYFTYAVLRDGIFCLNARGKVAVFGSR